jgi:hypothetical protein
MPRFLWSYRRILVTCGVRRQLFETAISGNSEHLRKPPGPIWPRSRPAVEAFTAARVLLLLFYLRRVERRELVLRIEFVIAFMPPKVVNRVRMMRML